VVISATFSFQRLVHAKIVPSNYPTTSKIEILSLIAIGYEKLQLQTIKKFFSRDDIWLQTLTTVWQFASNIIRCRWVAFNTLPFRILNKIVLLV